MSRPFRSLINGIQIIFGCALLAYYLLPGTILAKLTPAAIVDSFMDGTDVTPIFRALSFCVPAAIVFFQLWRKASGVSGQWLVYLTVLYVVPLSVTALYYGNQLLLIDRCYSVSSAIVIGLAASLLYAKYERQMLALSLFGVIQASYAINYWFSGVNLLQSGSIFREGGTFNNRTDLYFFMILVLPLTFSIYLNRWRIPMENRYVYAPIGRVKFDVKHVSYVFQLIFAIMLAALLFTWSRSALLGIVVIVGWICFRSRIDKVLILRLLVIVGILSAGGVMYRMSGAANRSSATASINGRAELYTKALRVFSDNRLAGVGDGCLTIKIYRMAGSPAKEKMILRHDPNSFILLVLAERGMIGGILLLLFIIVINRQIAAARLINMTLATGLGASWLGLIVACTFDTPIGLWVRGSGDVLLGALLGATIMLRMPCPKNVPSDERKINNRDDDIEA